MRKGETVKKILILTSSPQRDKLIDILLAEKLKAKGNEVYVRSIPIGARKALLEIQPNVIISPPIRQRFAYDLTETAGKFGMGVVIRHVEPSCDEQDLENMGEFWKKVLLLIRPPSLNLEIFWSDTEINFIRKHGIRTRAVAVGAFVADIYKDKSQHKNIRKQIPDKASLFKKYQLSPEKPLVLISAPWGLIDLAPDNSDKSATLCSQDEQAKEKWCQMVKTLGVHLKDWNILTTLHPRLDIEAYRKNLPGIPIDTTSTATELLVHSDCLIHAGSTMSVEMHWLNKPSFQYGDVNSLELPDGNWWQRRDCPISQISPYFTDIGEMIKAVQNTEKSNANVEAIKLLEEGRYGKMDGKATERAANLINEIDGEFKYYWPESTIDYDQLFVFKKPGKAINKILCNVCEKDFYVVSKEWLEQLNKMRKITPPIEFPTDNACPHCAHNIAKTVPIERQFLRADK